MSGSDQLPHLDDQGAARMVNVSAKALTARSATARGWVALSADAMSALAAGQVPKGDALAVARIAGLQAAKMTPQLIPLAHPVAIHGVEVELELVPEGVHITARVHTVERTGIEMEALTCVSVAALALIDMVKAVDRTARIMDVRVTAKSGGRSGDWTQE